jgi:hypothetical protein
VLLLLLCHQVTAAEGFGKTRLFEILDDLEVKTRPIMEAARDRLAKEKGAAALEPHNISQALAGEASGTHSANMMHKIISVLCAPMHMAGQWPASAGSNSPVTNPFQA